MNEPCCRTVTLLAFALGAGACASNREALSAPQPETLASYLTSKHPADILVTDRRGGSHWFHHPVVDGDTLRGVRNNELPQPRLAMAIEDVARVEEPHFSAGKTLLLIGSFVAGVGAFIVIAIGNVRTDPI